jgi:flagellar biosynthesis protein FliR
MMDPMNGVNVAVLSQFYLMLVTLLFLAMNGHLVMIEVLVESFRTIPIGLQGVPMNGIVQIFSLLSWMFVASLMVALPAVTALLVVNLSFGVMTRAAPQMNIFSLGFPFSVVFGLLVIWVSLSGFLPQFQRMAEEMFAMLKSVIGAI